MRLLWLASCIGLLYTLFSTYSEISPWVNLNLQYKALPVSREAYFYGAAGTFIFFSILILALLNAVPLLPRRAILAPNKDFWFSNFKHRRELNGILQGGIYAIAALMNYGFAVMLITTGANNHVYGAYVYSADWQLPAGALLLALVPVAFLRLFFRKINLLDNKTEIPD